MKPITRITLIICTLALYVVLCLATTNEPPQASLLPEKTNQLAAPTNLRTNPVTKLQSTQAAKTNAPVFHVEQSGNSGSFEDGAIFGALAFSRNPDVRDAKTIVDIARGLWQAQKRADALRQTNSPAK